MNASKIISNAFNDWQKSCQETRRGQTALLQKIKKYASKLNKREKRHFLREAENFCEKYDLLMSEPFTRLDEYLAKFEQLEWEEKQNKKQADSSKVCLNFLLLINLYKGQSNQSKKTKSCHS